ncbi:hypothetical protein [Pseudomonas fluorescens]|uniref:hypothetical protein n=1 Tax=Pseudomonas fluorescens TaxID=294 RepID=UPI001BE58FB1|nr:hypothetical protein [Pseudomonas fluorescens]MBT2375557.1 hypothetical protein [Pseudomonas fluorescens]
MPKFVHERSEEEIQRRWDLARAAQKAEFKRSLHDPKVWGAQGASVMGAMIKTACLFCVCEIAFRRGGAAPITGVLSTVLTFTVVGINPWQMFWRVVFRDRADAAFTGVINDLNEKEIE